MTKKILNKALLALLCLSPLSAFATLGQSATSVVQDRLNIKTATNATNTASTVAVSSATDYTVQTVESSDTQKIYEYVNASNIVFAVSWSGFVKPDLNSLLGQYFTQMSTANHIDNAHLMVNSSDVVINSSGRVRNFYGYAYVKSITPSDFTPIK